MASEEKLFLSIENLSQSFSGLKAVANFSMQMEEGELVGLIGPNGAGKTTIFNLLTGIYAPTEGSIIFRGQKLNGLPAYKVAQRGLARTFQNIRLFADLSVVDNVKIAYHQHVTHTALSSMLRLPGHFKNEKIMGDKALELLKVFQLEDKALEQAKNLPYGQQRRLEIARAMATEPKLLLLDEPAAGMNPQETRELMDLIRWLRETYKLTILLIEHDMALVMGVCERVYVLEYGMLLTVGTPDEVRGDQRVIDAYLGEEAP
ncbi:MAG: ABC transporter ATP-binding protein [Gracilibacteraceae bacterium]|jgi:branched-chain amino acid transport system ATP-binding protein|nr:ABC transporter ATP-binding protein [Gracilibacteraceae bacterium]